MVKKCTLYHFFVATMSHNQGCSLVIIYILYNIMLVCEQIIYSITCVLCDGFLQVVSLFDLDQYFFACSMLMIILTHWCSFHQGMTFTCHARLCTALQNLQNMIIIMLIIENLILEKSSVSFHIIAGYWTDIMI